MLSRLFIAGLLAFLLLGAGHGASQAARYTPWDCSDWQAYAHADRATAILESLAENRGKTLYCGIDQSDTFAKAETWEAGRDRNERDGTVYQGENGRFRGFIAAQEGWLTEGESGITGQPISTIFEFPKEGRVIRRTKRFSVGTDPEQFPINAVASCGQVLGILCTGEHTAGNYVSSSSDGTARRRARNAAAGLPIGDNYHYLTWDTNIWYTEDEQGGRAVRKADPESNQGRVRYKTPYWQDQAATAAARACRARGARALASSVQFGMGHNENRGGVAQDNGPGLGYFLRRENHPTPGVNAYRYQARQSRTWSATCVKKIRRTS